MKVHWRLALVVIALTALLVPLLSDLVRDRLLTEIVRLVWRVDRLVSSLPQEPFWIFFLLVAALAAAASLLPQARKPDPPLPHTSQAESQVAELAILIRRACGHGGRATRRAYFRRRLVQRLAHLGREVFADRHSAEPQPGIEAGPELGGPLVPRGAPRWHRPAAQGRPARGAPQIKPPPADASLLRALEQLRAEPDGAHGAVDPAVESFVQFLEEQLEV